MEGTEVETLVREDPTCCGDTKPCATAADPCSYREAPAMRSPSTTTGELPGSLHLFIEKAHAAAKTRHGQKEKKLKKSPRHLSDVRTTQPTLGQYLETQRQGPVLESAEPESTGRYPSICIFSKDPR